MSYSYPISRDAPINTEISDPTIHKMVEDLKSKYEDFDNISISISQNPEHWTDMKAHIETVAWFGAHLARAFNLSSMERDILLAACYLHDISAALTTSRKRDPDAYQRLFPTGYNRSREAFKNHPMLGSFIIGQYILENELYEDQTLIKVAKLVSTHMSHWLNDTCPEPNDKLEILMTTADYLGSRKEIHVDENISEAQTRDD